MGLYNLLDREKVSPGLVPAQVQSTNFFDVVETSFRSTMDNFRVNSESALIGEGIAERDKKYKELTGRDIYEDAYPQSKRPSLGKAGAIVNPNDEKVQKIIDEFLDQAMKDGRFGDQQLLNYQAITEAAQQRARASLAKQQEAAAGASKTAAIAGSLTGGLGAMFFDPLNVATLPFGAGASRSLLKTIFIEAGINAGIEAASQPFVAEWQNKIGNQYGFTDAIENVGMAAIFGGGVPLAGRAIRGGVEAFDGISATLKKYGKIEEAASADYMARVAHIQGSVVPYSEVHIRALYETNEAILNGRHINPEKTDVPIPKHTDDPSMRSTVERFNDTDAIADDVAERLRARGQIVEGEVNPLLREEKPRSPDIEVQEKIEELYSSPEAIRAEQESFDDIANLPDEKPIEFDADGQPTKTIGDYKREIEADKDFLNAIRTCSL